MLFYFLKYVKAKNTKKYCTRFSILNYNFPLLVRTNCQFKFQIYLNKYCVILSVLRLSSISCRRIFPVEIQSVKIILAEESDRAADESFPAGRICDERTESSRTFVPASDGEQRLQVAVVSFQGGKLTVTT